MVQFIWNHKHDPNKDLKSKDHEIYGSEDCGGVSNVHTKNEMVEFFPPSKGLHYFDLNDADSARIMLVSMVDRHDEGFMICPPHQNGILMITLKIDWQPTNDDQSCVQCSQNIWP